MLTPESGAIDPSRRRMLRRLAIALAVTALHPGVLPASVPVVSRSSAAHRRTFVAVCDTLVPADTLTPAASALGVPETILADIESVADARRLLALACDWLDARAGGDFAARGEDEREAVMLAMAAQPWESPAGRFFVLVRNTVMAEYYTQPGAWRGLALDRTPQPLGFPQALR